MLLDTVDQTPLGVGPSRSVLFMEFKPDQDLAYFAINNCLEKVESGSMQFSKSSRSQAADYLKTQLKYFAKS